MTIRHHLTDQLLMAYAAGELPEAFSLVVATHVSLCDECRARLESFETLGGAVLSQTEGATLADDSLAATMALITEGDTDTASRPRPRRRQGICPAPLAEYVGGGPDAVKWRRIGGGVRQALLPGTDDTQARLLHIPAGVAVPEHSHRGIELTLVLQGAFRDEYDRFGPGDVEIASETDEHTPIAEPGLDCICLAATDAPLRFNALLPRIVQPIFRI